MTDASPSLFSADQTGRRVRLRTLTTLRWAAIAGQIVAIAVSQRLFGLQIELGLCAVAIGASIIANVVFHFVFPENRRLNEREATLMLAFDTVQLGFLLGVTGGLLLPGAAYAGVPKNRCRSKVKPRNVAKPAQQ